MENNPTSENKIEEPNKEGTRTESGSSKWRWVIGVVVVVFIVLLAYAYRPKSEPVQENVLPAPVQIQTESDGLTSGDTAAGVEDPTEKTRVFAISGKPFEFSVKEIRVKQGDKVRIDFTSTQGLHDWVVDEFNAKTKQLTAGQSESVTFKADKTGTFEYYCSVGNHRQMGMVGKLIVE